MNDAFATPTNITEEGHNVPPMPGAEDPGTVTLGRYVLGAKHAEGGLGEVFLAVDTELNRDVALKRIKAQNPNVDHCRRFLVEGEVTGRLEHPGVVPVYGLGHDAAGRPYYVMRFVRGETLQEAIQRFHAADGPGRNPGERSKALRELLGQFVATCNTVAYAHSRGILHRDLKPANIMLGPYGETLVVDWGLAKPFARSEEARSVGEETLAPGAEDSQQTRQGQAVGTPQYMSPEQAAGRWSAVGPASDVYSLGATLYHLLAGKVPFDGRDVGEVMDKVKRGAFPPPSQRKPEVPRALEAVCLKAMALAPEDRYQSALDLAAEVKNWLADEPVGAWREPWRARAGRWVRRHPSWVSGGVAAVLLAVVVTLAAGLVRQAKAEREIEALKAQQAGERERQAVRSLFDRLDVSLAVGKADQAEPLLEQIRKSMASMNDPDLQQRLAASAADLATLQQLDRLFAQRWEIVQQTVIEQIQTQKGDWLTRMQARLVSGFSPQNDARFRQDYATVFSKHGLALGQIRAAELARQVQQSRIKSTLVKGLSQWFLIEPQSQPLHELLNVLDVAGQPVRKMLADFAAGKQPGPELAQLEKEEHAPDSVLYLSELLPDDRAIALLKKAVERAPDDARLLTVLVYRLLLTPAQPAPDALEYARAAFALAPQNSSACLMLTYALEQKGRLREALRQAETAVKLNPMHAFAHREVGELHLVIAIDPTHEIHYFQPLMLQTQNRVLDQRHLEQAVLSFNQAIELDPRNARHHNNLGSVYFARKEYDKAIVCWEQSIALDPELFAAQANLGGAFTRARKYDQAIAAFKTVIASLEKSGEFPGQLSTVHNNLGFVYIERKKYDKALVCFKKALEIEPKNAIACVNIGVVYGKTKENDQALLWLKKALELDPRSSPACNSIGSIYRSKGDDDQAMLFYKRALEFNPENADAMNNVGELYRSKKASDEAIAWLKKSLDLDPDYVPALNNLGLVFSEKGKFDEGIALLKKAIALDPDDPTPHNNLGLALKKKGDLAQAVASLERAIALDENNATFHGNLGMAYLNNKEFDQAIASCKKAIELGKKSGKLCNTLGLAYNGKKEYGQGVQWFKQAIELDPKNANAHNGLGLAHFGQKQFQQSIPWFKKAIELGDKTMQNHALLGVAFVQTKKYDQAIPCLKKAIDLGPPSAYVYFNLGLAYQIKKEYGLATAALKMLIGLEPKNADAQVSLGSIYQDMGDHDQAMVWLEKAVDLDPKNAAAQFRFATALAETGRRQEARESLKRALDQTSKESPGYPLLKKSLEDAEALGELEPRLAEIVKGDLRPKDIAQGFQFGKLCRLHQHYPAALHLYGEALALDKKKAEKLESLDLLNLARVSLLAAESKGNEPPPQSERAKYRAGALKYLRQSLQASQKAWDDDPQGKRYVVQGNVRILLQHQGLVSVRPPSLDSLPEADRNEWQAFWSDVRKLLQQADAPPNEP